MNESDNIRITVCGDGGAGKSSISLRLVRSKWTHDYDPTIEDSYSVTRIIDGLTYHLHLTDTAGQEEYRGLWSASNLRDADAFLLVYDITSLDSLAALDYFHGLIEMDAEEREEESQWAQGDDGVYGGEVRAKQVKFVAGNKVDLAQSRQVTSAQGLEWARSHGCGFMETSARNMVNIEETFALIVRRVVEARRNAANGADERERLAVANAAANANTNTNARGATPSPNRSNEKREGNTTPLGTKAKRRLAKCCVIC